MRYIILISTALALFISCNTFNDKTASILSKPGEVIPDEYVINIERDTTLVTKQGALIKIPKGSLETEKGNSVTLEIKEAYSIEQMIQAGLTTQSNGELLSSGGMIYINAKGGQNVTIKQAIKVALPADYLNPDMQLYKGEETGDGTINWTSPSPLSENRQLSAIDTGRLLFQSRCASCHSIGKDMTGPDLAHIKKRFPIHDEESWAFYEHGFRITEMEKYHHFYRSDIYKCNLVERYGSVGPILFTDTSHSWILSIYNYIQNESDKNQLQLPNHAYLLDCADSCINYLETVMKLKEQKKIAETRIKNLINDNEALVEEKKISATAPAENTPLPPVDFDDKVSPKNYGAVYYQFTIETFGWFNIDVLIKGQNGIEESELFVRIIGEYREKVQVYLIIPSVKVYVQGGPAERNEEEFAFLYKNGKIPLPQGAKAFIMAVTETESSIAFALKEFTITTMQELEISLQRSTKEAFNAEITSIGGDDLKITVADSKNAVEIRQSDADLKTINENLKKAEGLKPKNCNCKCGVEGAVTLFEKNATDTSR